MKTTLSLAETAKCHIHYGDEPLVSAPDDPTADESGMIPISRSIMESHLGRKLKYHRKNNSRNEEVHHLDMNRGNNSLENLHVLRRHVHQRFHKYMKSGGKTRLAARGKEELPLTGYSG